MTVSRVPAYSGNVLLVTLGCAKNLVDSEVMLGALAARGFRPTDCPEEADLIVVNTCAFLQCAVEESIDRVLELAAYKQQGRCRRLVVAGCMVERYREKLHEELPEVDQFLSTDEILDVGQESKTTSLCLDSARRPYFLYDDTMPRIRAAGEATAYVKIAEGCSRPCSFCIIPRLRGEYRSRSVESVQNEVGNLLSKGIREVNLVAQDSTGFGAENSESARESSRLPELLLSLGNLGIDPLEYWVRVLYAYPSGITDRLLEAISSSPYVCDYLDLPLQHVSHNVLKDMRRPLGGKGTRQLIAKIREHAPGIALRTTFLVGFPGESEDDIRELEQFVSEGHFTHVGVFTYSHEPEAESYRFLDQVEKDTKEERRSRIIRCQQEVIDRRARDLIGARERVLIEGRHHESDLLLCGRAAWQAPETDGEIIINEIDESLLEEGNSFSAERVSGRFGDVQITEQAGCDLVGRLIRVKQ